MLRWLLVQSAVAVTRSNQHLKRFYSCFAPSQRGAGGPDTPRNDYYLQQSGIIFSRRHLNTGTKPIKEPIQKEFRKLFFGGVWDLGKKVGSDQDHSWGTVTALKSMFFPESFLQGVKISAVSESLNRRDRRPIALHSQLGTGLYGLSILQYGAGTA